MYRCLLLFFFGFAASLASEETEEELNLIQGESKVFQSPNYPEDAPAHLRKTWYITTEKGSRIKILCEDFRFFESVPCGDYAVVFNDGEEAKEVCGVHFGFSYVSKGPELDVNLRTGKWDRGFLSCTAESIGEEMSKEDNELENSSNRLGEGSSFNEKDTREAEEEFFHLDRGKTKIFQSPNYPEDAPARLLKTWVFSAEPGFRISITCDDFRFFESRPCGDYAVVFKEDEKEKEVCGVHWDFNFISSGSKVEVTLRTGKWDRGFLSCRAESIEKDDLRTESNTPSNLEKDLESYENEETKEWPIDEEATTETLNDEEVATVPSDEGKTARYLDDEETSSDNNGITTARLNDGKAAMNLSDNEEIISKSSDNEETTLGSSESTPQDCQDENEIPQIENGPS